MKRSLIFTLLASCIFAHAYGQQAKVNYGIYEGFTFDHVPITWILNHDSTFIFLSFEGKYIKYLDAGKWRVTKPGFIKFTFSEIIFPILQNASYQYTTETKPPFDSLFIKGHLKSTTGKDIANASVILNGKYEIGSDRNGYFSNVRARSLGNQNLTIVKKIDGFDILTIPLNTNTNYHNIDIIMPDIDSTTADVAYENHSFKYSLFYKKELEVRYFNTREKNMAASSILFKTADLSVIVDKLNKAKQDQPRLLSNINQLLRMLNK